MSVLRRCESPILTCNECPLPTHVVDELDRHTQPSRRLGVRVALLYKPYSTFTQLNRMRFTHL